MTVNLDNYLVFLLVMIRFLGMLFFNPILGRTNIPNYVKIGLAFILAILFSGIVPAPALHDPTMLMFAYWVVKELLVGLVSGFLLRMFLSAIVLGGDKMDMQMGISMSKAFDPGSNASISTSAQFINIMFYLIFFLTGAHLNLIRMTVQSFTILPVGTYLINFDTFYLIPQLFTNVLILGVKMALPIVVVEIVTTFAIGIIMRIVPQINVFVINIQIKLLVGILLLVLLVPTLTAFVENLLIICTENIWSVWQDIGSV